MISFIYNGVDFSSLVTVNAITGRGTLSSRLDTVEIQGRDGVYAYNKYRNERKIEVSFSLVSSSPSALRSFVDVFNSLLDLEEAAPLVFSDEPSMTYYAYAIASGEWAEDRSFAQATVSFVCPDPYKYGPLNTASLYSDKSTLLNIGGTAPTQPRFELTVLEDATFAMVAKDTTQYMMVGREAEIEQEVFDPKQVVLTNSGTTTSGWSTAATGEINGLISGAMTVNGSAFLASSYGTGDSVWHGPAIKHPLPTGVQDFTAELGVDFGNTGAGTNLGRVEMYLLSSSGELLGRIAIKDNYRDRAMTVAEAQAGGNEGHFLINSEGPDNGTAWNNFSGILRLSRSARTWEAYVAQVNSKGEHGTRMTRKWTDVSNQSLDEVAQVVIHTGQYYNWVAVPKQHITHITITKFTRAETDDQVPFAINAGDELIFDHDTGEISKNGLDIRREKNFGGFPFELSPGTNTITLLPSNKISGRIRWRNAYL